MANTNWKLLAEEIAFGGGFTLPLIQAGVKLKEGKTRDDILNAEQKAFATPPFKTEHHIEKFSSALKKLVTPIEKEIK